MSERNSPYFAAGLKDGAADAARRPSERRGYDPDRARSWMYKRGFARSFRIIRAMARDGTLDSSPGTLAAMQAGIDQAWDALDALEAAQKEAAT
jgi:hypothetical protein